MILKIWQVQGLSLESKGFENILDFIFDLYEEGLPYLETHLDVESSEEVGGKEAVVR